MDPLEKLIDAAPALIATRYFTRSYLKPPFATRPNFLTGDLVPVMGCTILIWDHLLTLGDEIKYIWRRPVELSKAVFIFNRYFVEVVVCLSAYGEFEDFLKPGGEDLIWGLQYCWTCVVHYPRR
jgi:hypothetical protein